MVIADAGESHLPEILEIYNHVIATTTAVYSEEPVTLESRVEWWKIKPRYRNHLDQGSLSACGGAR